MKYELNRLRINFHWWFSAYSTLGDYIYRWNAKEAMCVFNIWEAWAQIDSSCGVIMTLKIDVLFVYFQLTRFNSTQDVRIAWEMFTCVYMQIAYANFRWFFPNDHETLLIWWGIQCQLCVKSYLISIRIIPRGHNMLVSDLKEFKSFGFQNFEIL